MSRRPIGACAALLVVLTACGGQAAPVHPATTASAPACIGKDARSLVITADERRHLAALYGSGPLVIVAHQSNQDICGSVPYARWLGAAGFTGVAFEVSGGDWPSNLAAALSGFRARGAQSVALLGASKRGIAAIVASAQAGSPVAAVVSLSGERQLPGLDADTAVRHSMVPILVVAGADDYYLSASDARALLAEAASSDKELIVVPGNQHGFELLDGNQGSEVRSAVLGFLRNHAHQS